jgi:2,4-dienoyl-CoA reductase-like NADH-dependent reductase (Old Yellow Enzyme family)
MPDWNTTALDMISSSVKIGDRIASTRIVNQPMECNDGDAFGNPTDLTFRRYRRLAQGGAGIIFVESLSVTYESRARKAQLLIADETAKTLEKLVCEMRQVNEKPLILFQITHSGSQSNREFSKVLSVYAKHNSNDPVPSEDEIQKISDLFVKAAVIAKQVGADGIDFKQAHGYFCGEFLQPANIRMDRYGGSFENRTRFFRETIEKIKHAIGKGSFLLGARISAYEGIPGGFGTAGPEEVIEDLSEPVQFAKMIEAVGMHFINVSGGIPSLSPEIEAPTKRYPQGVHRHFGWTKTIKRAVTIPVIGSAYSYLRDGQNELEGAAPIHKSLLYWAEKNLRDGNVDLVGIGRQSLADPLFVNKVTMGELDQVQFCTLCGGCTLLLRAQKPCGCVVHDGNYRGRLTN